MVELKPSKLMTRVRFPLSAPLFENSFMKKFLAKLLISALKAVETPTPTVELPAEPVPAPEAPLNTWTHNSDLYRLMIPNSAFDPNSSDSGFMATVVTNKETNESRLIPYVNVPVASRVITLISGTSGQTIQTKEWEIIGDEA